MRIGSLISLTAETYGLPPETVTLVARALREAGWLTTGARGVNAPEMTPQDAARLSLALLSGAPPGKVVEEFEFQRRLEAKDLPPTNGFTAGSGLGHDHTFEDALVWLFGLTSTTPNIQDYKHELSAWHCLTVSVDSSARAAQIHFPNHTCVYEDLAVERELDELRQAPYSIEKIEQMTKLWNRSGTWESSKIPGRGMRVVRTIDGSEISKITDAIAATSLTAAGRG